MTAPRTVAEVLDAAADLLTPEGAWTHDALARNADKEVLANGYDDGAVCWCMMGAIEHAAGQNGWLGVATEAFEEIGVYRPYNFNDAPDRTQAEVVAKLREAAALAREHGK